MAQQHNVDPFAKWVAQLKDQEPEYQAFAACELGRLACQKRSNVDLVVRAGAIPALINLLSSPHALVQEHAVGTLGTLASYPSSRLFIPAAVAVPAVVNLLRKDSPEVLRNAADALANLAYECSGNKAAIIAAGAIPLLELLCGSSCNLVQQFAARALCFIAAGNRQLEPLITFRALPTLVRQLKPGIRLDASSRRFLTNIARRMQESVTNDRSNSRSARTEDPAQSALQYAALKTLCEVMVDDSFSAGYGVSMLLAAGVPEAIVTYLQDGNSIVKARAFTLLCQMGPQFAFGAGCSVQ